MASHRTKLLSSGVGLLSMLLAGVAVAESCQVAAGNLVTAEGQVDVQRSAASSWEAALQGGELCQGDTVRAAANSRATIRLVNQAILRVDQNTAMRLDNIAGVATERSSLSLLEGAFHSFSRKPRGFEVSTPYLNGSIEGTEFVFRVKQNTSELTVLEGLVLASNELGSVEVAGGESALSAKGQAPSRRTLVNPRDAVQWSLYYPPLQAAPRGKAATSTQKAANLLSVGRVDEARTNIDAALRRDPNNGEGYALRAVINVAQNNNDQAMADARQAVALNPGSASAKIALSYAQQAAFDLEGAQQTLQQAVQQQPGDALAWARLAELQLMLGDRQASRDSAQKAVSLQPQLGRTQTTLGFAALAEFRNAEAMAAFERAIAYDSADPLAHLGLGLARISSGALEAGRADIEVAVGLGSNDALLRAYLGKAYFEEKRSPLDTEQFAIAKQLDPRDPTAYLYEGIALQTQNRPIEAVRELEKSIELNDNRAVYRSRLLLDKDRAARGTSLARIYNDLGFTTLGINVATGSLAIDPENASAHRFLSDIYGEASGRLETARVSELLQSQLLQELNLNPIQPSVSSTNLNIVTAGGPARAGFNEYTPLFERNKMQFNITGFGGSNDTLGGEAVVSGIYNAFSGSAGYFNYNTNGYRPNNELDHEIWDVFGQWAVSQSFNVQAEFRHRDTEHGDLQQNFDLDDFDPTFRVDTDEDIYRLGARISPDEQSTILFSYIHSDLDSTRGSVPVDDIIPAFIPGFPDGSIRVTEDSRTSQDVDQFEGLYLYQRSSLNVVAGGTLAISDADEVTSSVATIEIPPILPPTSEPPIIIDSSSDTDDSRIYVYADWEFIPSVTGTFGVSYINFESDVGTFDKIDIDEFSPKLGVRWEINNKLTARAAYFKNIMPVLASKRTLEPTQVAGFNQFFDDPNATKSTRYAAALDWQHSEDLAFGIEFSKRDVESPVLNVTTQTIPFEDRDERNYRAYGYWTPMDRWSLGIEAIYDSFENTTDSLVSFSVPSMVTTWTLPARATYFHPSGWFGSLGITYVDQEVRREVDSLMAQGDSSFTLADVALGYRLPNRKGVFSLTVNNLFDTDFDYQDDSYRTFRLEPYVSPYVPEITVMGRLTLNF